MSEPEGLDRFVQAQATVYATALRELREGRKRSHWMWFIFPVLRGLGVSPMSRHFGIASREEAAAYLAHPLLGPRLEECTQVVNGHRGGRAEDIFGPVDALKLRSSMTLFDLVGGGPPFGECLDAFFGGALDRRTVQLLNDSA